MLKSKLEPCFGTDAGERFTVILRAGNGNLELVVAERTRDAASWIDASGSPTNTNAGKLLEMSVSTSMMRPVKPNKLIESVLASGTRKPVSGVQVAPFRDRPKQIPRQCEHQFQKAVATDTIHRPTCEVVRV